MKDVSGSKELEVADDARALAFGAKLARLPQPSFTQRCCKHPEQHRDNVTRRDHRPANR